MSDKKEYSKFKLDRPYIVGNEYGGVVYIGVEDNKELAVQIWVNQYELHGEEGEKIKKIKRTGCIGGTGRNVDVLLSPEMAYEPGERIGGIVVVKESYDPLYPEDPELNLKRDHKGNIIRVNGKCVYRTEEYFFKVDEEQDELISE